MLVGVASFGQDKFFDSITITRLYSDSVKKIYYEVESRIPKGGFRAALRGKHLTPLVDSLIGFYEYTFHDDVLRNTQITEVIDSCTASYMNRLRFFFSNDTLLLIQLHRLIPKNKNSSSGLTIEQYYKNGKPFSIPPVDFGYSTEYLLTQAAQIIKRNLK